MVLRALRPELKVTPYDDGVVVQPIAVTDGVVSTPVAPIARPAETEDAPPAKKIKVSVSDALLTCCPSSLNVAYWKHIQLNALESALSLLDCLRKLCAERVSEGPFNPAFDITDITEAAAGTPGEKRKFR